ncbi:peroxisomal coenzyme A diphosphatase NUDT7 [Danio rerio]|uniref:Peroxisomal coenzyme A diphosphatase NUDT7 n=1 Tax=Danio rerio TaxID=7955 RepID=E7FAS2_DANRE|nr:peroxisomal coenzyme A diphosphatase NUDT7 [Danio rerio]|eukprot:XP_005163269.1 peroxisomal coenzyme A diphosphatase NUDT7 [Danio rerio]
MELKERVTAALRSLSGKVELSRLPIPKSLPKASVLIPLLLQDGELRLLLTVRSIHLSHHAGEVCFPGGKCESSDRDDVHTALREAEEEIGLPADAAQVIATLFPVINKAGLLITPVVAFIQSSFRPSINPQEVSEVFTLPLDFFTRADHHSGYPVPSVFGPTHSFMYTDPASGRVHQIWGLTAALAITVAAIGLQKTPEFQTGFDLEDPVSTFRSALQRRLSKL